MLKNELEDAQIHSGTKSRLAQDLSHALMLAQLRDHLAELMDNPGMETEKARKLIKDAYLKATVLVACSVVDTNNRMLDPAA